MKKVISLVLAMVMVLAFSGCGQKSVDYDEKSEGNESKGITEQNEERNESKNITEQNNETDSNTVSSSSVEIRKILCYYDIHEENSEPIKITDSAKISEFTDTLLEIEWTPKTEGNWPKYSVNHPNHSIEIQTTDKTFVINLFDDRFVAIMSDENWQRYEISKPDYENLKRLCKNTYEK